MRPSPTQSPENQFAIVLLESGRSDLQTAAAGHDRSGENRDPMPCGTPLTVPTPLLVFVFARPFTSHAKPYARARVALHQYIAQATEEDDDRHLRC